MAFGVLAGLLVLLLAAVACDSGCIGYARIASVPRPMTHQLDTAVRVEVTCMENDPFVADAGTEVRSHIGSGTILDARHVLTALHVVDCPYIADVHVVLSGGRRLRVNVERTWQANDAARLEIASAETFGNVPPPPIRFPVSGERGTGLCAAVSYPEAGGTCGQLEAVNESICADRWCRDLNLTMTVVPGNSGAPLYDAMGTLIGIVTGTQTDAAGTPTGTAYGHTLPKDVMP